MSGRILLGSVVVNIKWDAGAVRQSTVPDCTTGVLLKAVVVERTVY